MKLVIAAGLALAFATAAAAQEVPEASQKDLWCGLAFGIVINDAPADVTPELREIYEKGAETLVSRATTAHLEAGYTEEAFEDYKGTLSDEVNAQISTTNGRPAYAFEECSALIGL